MLYLALAEAIDRKKSDSTHVVDLALDEAAKVRDSRQAMECSFLIANVIASRQGIDVADAKSLHEALKQVKSDVDSLKRVTNGKWASKEISLVKYLTRIRSSAPVSYTHLTLPTICSV